MSYSVTYDSKDLSTEYGFILREDFSRPTPSLPQGVRAPGVDGVLRQLAAELDLAPLYLVLRGILPTANVPTCRTDLRSDTSYRNLVFSDLSPKYYAAKCIRADEGMKRELQIQGGRYSELEMEFEVSPPCLLAAEQTDTTSPVNNPGDYRCPAQYTITATGDFTLTVGSVEVRWTGGSGTVLIDTDLCRAYLGGTESPSDIQGGFPWLAVGGNTVTVSTGDSFSVAFNPRYA